MNSMVYRNKRPLLVFLIPTFIFMAVYLYYPFIQNIFNSMMQIDGLGSPASGFLDVWYENYVLMVNDPLIRTAIINTLLLTLCTIVFEVGIALILALLVDRITKGAQFFRTVYFFPIVISATALGLLFNLIFMYPGGMLNQMLTGLFGFEEALDFKDMDRYFLTMMVPIIWQYVGFYFVILVTGLNNISADMYEAGDLDGADGLKRTRYLTLPLLRNTMCTCLILAVTGVLKVFDLPWVMLPKGMPLDQSWLTGTYMYYQTFTKGDVDYGSAIAVGIVVLGIIFARTANSVFKEADY
ncbi:MAG: sugar ABC transporter permease [Eubacteriales bacterium]